MSGHGLSQGGRPVQDVVQDEVQELFRLCAVGIPNQHLSSAFSRSHGRSTFSATQNSESQMARHIAPDRQPPLRIAIDWAAVLRHAHIAFPSSLVSCQVVSAPHCTIMSTLDAPRTITYCNGVPVFFPLFRSQSYAAITVCIMAYGALPLTYPLAY